MSSGGARARSGPAPDPNALRRDRDGAGWVVLPAEGRLGDAPDWPLGRSSDRELALWEREWRRPQAVMWERNGLEHEVALYVRSFAAAEQVDATVASRTLVRQQQEALGISLPGLSRNRWRIAEQEKDEAPRQQRAGRSARDRLRVVSGDGAA